MKNRSMKLTMLAASLAAFGLVLAGSLDPPPGPPAPTMVTLQEIYDKIGANPGTLPKTGQTSCWNVSGTPIPCAGTGQDGLFQKGMAVPSPRFTDNGDGTVKDNLTGLIWLKSASCLSTKFWADVFFYTGILADGSCGLTDGSVAGDWRLPNIREMYSLIDFGQSGPALPAGHPFTGVAGPDYWTSTSLPGYPNYAWSVYVDNGNVSADLKTNSRSVWAVRGGE